LAKLAAKVMAGKTLAELGQMTEPWPKYTSVKESVFPFVRFAGVDIILGPEMRSTGEVMGIDESFPIAFAKSQVAAGNSLPRDGTVFISMAGRDKAPMIEGARKLQELGFKLVGTSGTARALRDAGVEIETIRKVQEGRPNLLDLLANGDIQLIFNTPSGKGARTDEGRIRSAAVAYGVPCVTTLAGSLAAIRAIDALATNPMPNVTSLQEWLGQM
jgi:carbamoyl-phosphate synthase large subunit